ncbi:MAG: hypothetical protein IJ639_11210 [Ruminococcus sp.]|nr:hypothetical protein [Ruminococcus sp.]
MQVYRIAGMNIAVEPRYEYTKKYLADYAVDDTDYELLINITDEMIDYEQSLNVKIHGEKLGDAGCESIAVLRVLCDYIIRRGGFFLHCSCLKYRGKAIIFTAPSGTGKSTHAALWKQHFGESVEIINDDKPLVREDADGFTIYGTPWRGKHGRGTNTSAPIGAVFFLAQAPENSVEPVDSITALSLLMQQTVIPRGREDTAALVDMLGRLIESVPMHRLFCNISDEAVTTALSALDF